MTANGRPSDPNKVQRVAGTLIGLYMMKHMNFSANECMAWLRIVRCVYTCIYICTCMYVYIRYMLYIECVYTLII